VAKVKKEIRRKLGEEKEKVKDIEKGRQ